AAWGCSSSQHLRTSFTRCSQVLVTIRSIGSIHQGEPEMNRRRGFGLLWGIVTLVIVGLVAAVAYQAGLSAQLATAGGTYVVAPHLVGLGFGFAFFWLLPILFLLLIGFRVFRGGRRWYGGGRGRGGGMDEQRLREGPR